jgi:hypothetical protein
MMKIGRKSNQRRYSMAPKKDDTHTLERGNIYFFYRPRVEEEAPESIEDVRRFYLLLSPEQKSRYRLAIIGRKRLPDPVQEGRERNWGFVSLVRKDHKSIREELMGEEYETKTRGTREVPAARPLGEGVYRILLHGDHTPLVYSLELRRSPANPRKSWE